MPAPAGPQFLRLFLLRAADLGLASRADVELTPKVFDVKKNPRERFLAWLYRAWGVRTEGEARAILGEMPPVVDSACLGEHFAGASCMGSMELDLAQVYALAGDWQSARKYVESSTKRCDHASWVLRLPRAFSLLGEARERTGDVAGAREAYETVIRRWGGLRPKAVDAEHARARLRALAGK